MIQNDIKKKSTKTEIAKSLGVSRQSLYYKPKKPDRDLETKKIILTLLATNYGLTDVALVKAYNGLNKARRSSESGIRSRRAELVAAGLVVDTGDRVKLPSNRLAIVWAVA